jgi:DNA repair exonuclease SbcCD nuclease subunit
MKLAILGDIHLTPHIPKCRLDDYPEIQLKKLQHIFDYCINNGVDKIVCVGDVVEKAQLPLHFASKLIKFFNKFEVLDYKIPFYSVVGNHDTAFHSLVSDNTIFGVMKYAGLINIDPPVIDAGICIQFVHYGQEIPKPIEGKYNILFIHAGISEDKAWWQEQTKEKWWSAQEFLAENPYELVFSGHNHKRFKYSARLGKKRLYNCGSICRASVDQYEHKPCFYILDTDTKEVEEIEIPIADASLVIDKERQDDTKLVNEKIASFVSGFDSEQKILLDFHSILWNNAKTVEAGEDCMKILKECVGD